MEQELEVLSNTDHPHIVRVMELLEDEAKFYIVSELVTGGELYDYIIDTLGPEHVSLVDRAAISGGRDGKLAFKMLQDHFHGHDSREYRSSCRTELYAWKQE